MSRFVSAILCVAIATGIIWTLAMGLAYGLAWLGVLP